MNAIENLKLKSLVDHQVTRIIQLLLIKSQIAFNLFLFNL